MLAFEKRAELLHLAAADLAGVEWGAVGVPVKMTVLEEVIPVGGVLVDREGKTDALEMVTVLADPFLPRFVPFRIGLPPIGHSSPPGAHCIVAGCGLPARWRWRWWA